MAMNFENLERNWRKGVDINKRFALANRNHERNLRIADHANRERSHYFAPGGRNDPDKISTDDLAWNTRAHAIEKQGTNIMKFPKTFEDMHVLRTSNR